MNVWNYSFKIIQSEYVLCKYKIFYKEFVKNQLTFAWRCSSVPFTIAVTQQNRTTRHHVTKVTLKTHDVAKMEVGFRGQDFSVLDATKRGTFLGWNFRDQFMMKILIIKKLQSFTKYWHCYNLPKCDNHDKNNPI